MVPVVMELGMHEFIERSTPLSAPKVAGLLFLTRILYFVPEGVFDGIFTLIGLVVPIPIDTGDEKLPDKSESSAV